MKMTIMEFLLPGSGGGSAGESFTQNPKAFKLRAVVSIGLIQLPRFCDTFTL